MGGAAGRADVPELKAQHIERSVANTNRSDVTRAHRPAVSLPSNRTKHFFFNVATISTNCFYCKSDEPKLPSV